MKNLILLKVTGIVLLGCQNNISTDSDYRLDLGYFDSKLIDQFPKNGTFEYFATTIDTSAYYNSLSIIATIKVSQKYYKEVRDKYINYPIIENSDKNIEILNPFLDGSNYPDSETLFCGPECVNQNKLDSPAYILPNFYFSKYVDSTTITRLPNSFKHIIVEQKKGIFSNKIKKDISTMPINYFHGYSKGISFNDSEKVILYWTILW